MVFIHSDGVKWVKILLIIIFGFHLTKFNLFIESFVTTYSKNIPFEGAFRRPKLTLTSNSLVHDYWVFISHLIPAYMTDTGLRLIGQKPRVVNVYNKIHKMLSSLEYLTENEWKCTYDNIISLRNSTKDSDSQVILIKILCFCKRHF